jgi:hypothetical protein
VTFHEIGHSVQYLEEGVDYHRELFLNPDYNTFSKGYNEREKFANDFSKEICTKILDTRGINFVNNMMMRVPIGNDMKPFWELYQKHKDEIKDVEDFNTFMGLNEPE